MDSLTSFKDWKKIKPVKRRRQMKSKFFGCCISFTKSPVPLGQTPHIQMWGNNQCLSHLHMNRQWEARKSATVHFNLRMTLSCIVRRNSANALYSALPIFGLELTSEWKASSDQSTDRALLGTSAVTPATKWRTRQGLINQLEMSLSCWVTVPPQFIKFITALASVLARLLCRQKAFTETITLQLFKSWSSYKDFDQFHYEFSKEKVSWESNIQCV